MKHATEDMALWHADWEVAESTAVSGVCIEAGNGFILDACWCKFSELDCRQRRPLGASVLSTAASCCLFTC